MNASVLFALCLVLFIGMVGAVVAWLADEAVKRSRAASSGNETARTKDT